MTHAPIPNRLELHYFFSDDSHSMDALVRNKCEQELLAIIREVATLTGVELRIETEAFAEGGLRERLKLITRNQYILTTVLAIVTSLVTTVPGNVLTHILTMDPEKAELEKQKLRHEVEQGSLDIEKTKLELERSQLENRQLKLDMKKHKRDLNEAYRVSPAVQVEKVVTRINANSFKIARHRSNFYRALLAYPKVNHISFTRLASDNQEAGPAVVVTDQEFKHYILSTDELSPIRDEEAIVEIISPVLKPGSYKWKGIYLKTGQPIDFYMKDQNFKDNVVRSRIPFRNGSRIACVLDISRRLTETGDAENTSYAVATVTATFEGEDMVETPQGRDYRLSKNQLQLAFE